VREDWVNLNGLWDLAVLSDTISAPTDYPDQILVPFPVESSLGGLARSVQPDDRVWYRRTFSLSGDSEDSRWLLHFGAVDWEAEVFLNGVRLGTHRGGYDPFTFDVSEALIEGGPQELVVAVRDPTDEGNQPRGKQVLEPHGIWYTAVTGIWQTVWLEPVPDAYVRELEITPDLQGESVRILARVEGASTPVGVSVAVLADGAVVQEASGPSDRPLTLPIPDPRTWSPTDPFLYGLRIQLGPAGPGEEPGAETRRDRVESYFGMRSIGVGPDDQGHQRLLLNGEPLFQYGLLDQGWWPDGLYTAPTDEALSHDVRTMKGLGFNLIRKHVKVEPARWYYHCDREGILVWQDMPSGDNEGEEARLQFGRELEAVVDALRNHPAIVMWVPFNEGWGQHATELYVQALEEMDPTRLVDDASGWTDRGVGSVLDIHSYPGPASPDATELSATPGRAGVLGEFGGLGLPLSGHTWVEEDNWGYRSYENLDDLNAAYAGLLTQLRPLIGEGLAAAVYTQTTDVEVEVNGIMTYDRAVVKLGDQAPELHRKLFGPPPVLREIIPTSREAAQAWRYTFTDPALGWTEPSYDDSWWAEGPGGFGTEGTPGARVRTVWDTPEIWLRRTVVLDPGTVRNLAGSRLFLRVHHDEDAQVYLNGTAVASLDGYSAGYLLVPLDEEAASLLHSGENLLAVHVTQTRGGQYIDVGIVEWVEPDPGG